MGGKLQLAALQNHFLCDKRTVSCNEGWSKELVVIDDYNLFNFETSLKGFQ